MPLLAADSIKTGTAGGFAALLLAEPSAAKEPSADKEASADKELLADKEGSADKEPSAGIESSAEKEAEPQIWELLEKNIKQANTSITTAIVFFTLIPFAREKQLTISPSPDTDKSELVLCWYYIDQ